MSSRSLISSARSSLRSQCTRSGATSAAAAYSSVAAQVPAEAKEVNVTPQEPSSQALVSSFLEHMVPTYSRPPPIFTKGKNARVWDREGNEYIDLTAGIAVNALGHADPGFLQELNAQAADLIHVSNLYHNLWTGQLSTLLVEKTRESGGMKDASRVFICNSGSEANEAAIKFSRKLAKVRYPDNPEKIGFVSFRNAFHGRTMGSLSATPTPKYQKPFAPMVPGFSVGDLNDIEALKTLVTENTAGVIVEPIQGEGGVHAATPEFLKALRARCNEVGALLIYDEIQSGLGRTGDLWAHTAAGPDAHPDILTMAKALGNGFPIGATMVTEAVAQGIQIGDHGTTFGGNPLACRLGTYVFSRLSSPDLLNSVRKNGFILETGLKEIIAEFPDIALEVRGRGLIRGLQLSIDPKDIVEKARTDQGVLVITAGTNTLRFLPPLTIETETLKEGIEALKRAFREVLKK